MNTLPGLEAPARERPLGSRQQFALDKLLAHDGSLTALELGRMIHTDRGCTHCQPWAACEYAEAEARTVLTSLRKRGLVVRRKTGRWELPGTSTVPARPSSQDDPNDPFGGF